MSFNTCTIFTLLMSFGRHYLSNATCLMVIIISRVMLIVVLIVIMILSIIIAIVIVIVIVIIVIMALLVQRYLSHAASFALCAV